MLGSLWLSSCTEPAGPRLENGGNFIAVSTGGNHSCAVTRTGAGYCWGSDAEGQLGDQSSGNSAIPVKIASNIAFVSVSAGDQHTCALDSVGQVHCWGKNESGQLGTGGVESQRIPTLVSTALNFVSLTSGWDHTCALTATGQAYCWGDGGEGQLGTGRLQRELTPAPVAGIVRFMVLSAGARHTCGLATDGAAYCWGENSWGQLGIGTLANTASPAAVVGGRTYNSISAGESHSCAVEGTNIAFCWGSAEYGEVGNSVVVAVPAYLAPEQVFNVMRYTTISAGLDFACGVDLTGLAHCWGRGVEGQLGNGQIQNWPNPQVVSDGQLGGIRPWSFVRIANGRTHACGLTDASTIYCWGRGEFGQLGNTTTSFAPLATRVRTQ